MRIFTIIILFYISSFYANAADFPSTLPFDQPFDAVADTLRYVGNKLYAQGHVRFTYDASTIECDSLFADRDNMFIHAQGNVKCFYREVTTENVTSEELELLLLNPNASVELIGPVQTPYGRVETRVQVTRLKYAWESDEIEGNLETGELDAKNFFCSAEDKFFVSGSRAQRHQNGKFIVEDAKVTTCDKCKEGCEHYALKAKKVELRPNTDELPIGMQKGNLSQVTAAEKYWIIMSNNVFLNIFDVPVFWLPGAILPPAENISEYIKLSLGNSSEWGFFASVGKRFTFVNESSSLSGYVEPAIVYFSKRGVGAGVEVMAKNDHSWTIINAFGLHDDEPSGGRSWEKNYDKKYGRYNINKERFDLRLQHLTHISNRLDLRAQIAMQSDNEVLRQFFRDRLNNDQQATYLALDYQFDRFIPSFYIRPKLNDWSNEVATLPEFRFDGPRQKLFGGIYYQTENSINYRQMRFAEFDKRDFITIEEPENYENARFDTLHMFYYPIKLDWLNLIPRAGGRVTAYDKTSEQKVTFDDLQYYKWATLPDFYTDLWDEMYNEGLLGDYIAYDTRGGSEVRFIGEIGLEANTKIYRAWNNYKNAFLKLDGLRHIITPYVNYNYNPMNNNISPDNILFFDQIDRYGKQHFTRFGVQQVVQTRRGPYYRERLEDIFSMENYFDYHMETEQGFSRAGDIGTLLKFKPSEKLKFTSALLIDPDPKNNHPMGSIEQGQLVDRKGLSTRNVSSWFNRLTYEFSEKMCVFAAYNMNDAYNQRSLYSMGSSLTDILSGTSFPNRYFRYQEARVGFEMPLPYLNDPTRFGIEAAYDFEAAYWRDLRFKLGRTFHCWDVALELRRSNDRTASGRRSEDDSIGVSVGISAFNEGKYLLRSVEENR